MRVCSPSFMVVLTLCVRMASAQQEVSFTETTVASFQFNGRKYPIHPMLGNDQRPTELQQFRYEPLLLPETDKDGKLAAEVAKQGDEWVVTFRIALGLPQADDAAFTSLKHAYPAIATSLRANNVSHMRLSRVRTTIPLPPGLGGPRELTVSPGAAPVFTVSVMVAGQKAAGDVREWLAGPVGKVEVEYDFQTRKAETNKFRVTIKSLAKTDLAVKLDGGVPKKDDRGDAGQRCVYVHRDDMRKLSQNLYRQIEVNGFIEDPNRFDLDLAEALLAHFAATERLEFVDFGKNRWESTYNPKDLDPDLIGREINDLFQKTQGKDEWHVKTEKAGEGGGGLSVGIFQLGGHGSSRSSFSSDQLCEFLSEGGLHVEIDGDRIVPKAVDVRRVNLSDFASDQVLTDCRVYVGQNVESRQNITVQLAEGAAKDGDGFRTIDGRVAELEKARFNAVRHLRAIAGAVKGVRDVLDTNNTTEQKVGQIEALMKRGPLGQIDQMIAELEEELSEKKEDGR